MLSSYILPLAHSQPVLETIGGKGVSLARLAAADLPVPGGFHITTAAYQMFVAKNNLQSNILEALQLVDMAQPATLEKSSAKIYAAFAAASIAPDLVNEIRQAYHSNISLTYQSPVAVRSSATAEDLPDMSFAGQMETYLNLYSEEQVLEAVRRCWASLWTARAIGYRVHQGISHDEVSLAVIVQQLVPADAAGVLFTANPLTGACDQVVINAAWGLGEAVVSGQVTPDNVVVNKVSKKTIEQQINDKAVMTVRTADGTYNEAVPFHQRKQAVLTPKQVAELTRLSVQIENLYGQPMDIEWALERDHFFILQARPITTLKGHNPIAGEWNDSLTGDYLWTNANYGEATPDVMTPGNWSFIQMMLDRIEPPIGPYRSYGNIGGRVYKNLSYEASWLAAFGLNPGRYIKLYEESLGRLPDGVEIPVFQSHRGQLLHMSLQFIIHVVRLLYRLRINFKRLPVFLAGVPQRCETLQAQIQAIISPTDLAALWCAKIAPFSIEAFYTVIASWNQNTAHIRNKLQKMIGMDAMNVLLTGPGGGQGYLPSLGPVVGLTQLANGEMDRETFVRQFGHRGPHEAEISIPRPAEAPEWIDQQLAALHHVREDVNMLLERQAAARQAAWEQLCKRYPRQKNRLRRQIEQYLAMSHRREEARSELMRVMWVVRAFFLRAGALTGQGEKIFFLSIDEILALLKGDRSSLIHIPARCTAYERYCALPTYPALIRGQFDPFEWAADPQRRNDFFDSGDSSSVSVGDTVTGFPGAQGIVEGRVRVLENPEDGDKLQPGEVLVTTVTNVGWTPIFLRAAAVVTDVGAPLSHAAIVARELGIPAVVGCVNATMHLRTGDLVRVNGGQGTVEIL